jgi:hypothetical protein
MGTLRLFKADGSFYGEIVPEHFKIIHIGKNANIHEYGTSALRIYHEDAPSEMRIKLGIFEELQDMDSYTIPRLHDCLFETDDVFTSTKVKGYTYRRLYKGQLDLLTMSSDRFISSVAEKLDDLANEVSKRRIYMSEAKPSGILITKGRGAFITNIDQFKKDKKRPITECQAHNKRVALDYLKMAIIRSAYNHSYGDLTEEVNELFNVDVIPSTDLVDITEHRLKGETLSMRLKK